MLRPRGTNHFPSSQTRSVSRDPATTTAAFLRSYRQTAEGATFLPSRPEQLQTLLEAFLLDKALYELKYELNNRPAWVRIPLHGILDLAR